MVINSTNINKTNNHLSTELNSLNTTMTTTYDVGNPCPGLGQSPKCGVVNGICFHSKRTQLPQKRQHRHGQYNSRVNECP